MGIIHWGGMSFLFYWTQKLTFRQLDQLCVVCPFFYAGFGARVTASASRPPNPAPSVAGQQAQQTATAAASTSAAHQAPPPARPATAVASLVNRFALAAAASAYQARRAGQTAAPRAPSFVVRTFAVRPGNRGN